MPNTACQPTKCCSFLFETPDSIFTPESFTAEEKLMIASAEQFSRQEVLPLTEAIDNKKGNLMPQLIQKAGELGFCGSDTPEAYGGLGLTKSLAARLLEFLSLNASFSVTLGVTSGVAQLGLILYGSEAQKKKYLPKLASGESIGAYALSEPGSGSDALSITTRADKQGNSYTLSGTKMWISNAMWADLFVVFAQINGKQFSAFLVEKNTPGLTIEREEHKLGIKGSSTARIVLENVKVPEENLLFEPGKGHYVALNTLNIGRFKLSAMSLGGTRAAIEAASKYAQERKQFGKFIASFGMIQKKFADMAALYFAAEAALYRTGGMMDAAFCNASNDPNKMQEAAQAFAVECSICKVLTTEAQGKIVDDALQIFGGYGYTEEFPIARIYRDSRVSRIYEGTNEINRISIVSRLRKNTERLKQEFSTSKDSFISELMDQALKHEPKDQIELEAIANLVILTYAEQSARIRAKQCDEKAQEIYKHFLNSANLQAAGAFQVVRKEPCTLPSPETVDIASIAEKIIQEQKPYLLN